MSIGYSSPRGSQLVFIININVAERDMLANDRLQYEQSSFER